MNNPLKRFRDYFTRDLWTIDRSALGRQRRFLLDTVRVVAVIVKDVLYGHLTLWATGMVYTALMSLVPLLAVAFSVLKAFGVQNRLEPLLLGLVAPLGPSAPVIAHRVVQFVNNMRVGVLGIVGLGLLMYTVMSLIQKMEQAFNAIWRVRGERSMVHQFTEYLSVVLAGPVLIVSALALTASLMSTSFVRSIVRIEPFGYVVAAAGALIPYALVCASFTFLYIFLPNTRVRWSAALAGGIVGGVLWETAGWGFAAFVVASTKYEAIYSSFAILILFMAWLYLSWLILLVGCEVSFYFQNPQMLSLAPAAVPYTRLIEQTAVSIMFLIASHFYENNPPWTVNALVGRLGLTLERIENVLAALKRNGLVVEALNEESGYVPGRDLDTILLQDVLSAVRWGGPGRAIGPELASIEPAAGIINEVDEAIGKALGSRSLKDLILAAKGAGASRMAA